MADGVGYRGSAVVEVVFSGELPVKAAFLLFAGGFERIAKFSPCRRHDRRQRVCSCRSAQVGHGFKTHLWRLTLKLCSEGGLNNLEA